MRYLSCRISLCFFVLTLGSLLLLFFLYSLAEESSIEKDTLRKREIAYELTFREAEIKFIQRQRPWEEKKEKISKEISPFQIQGYYKNLFTISKTTDTEEDFFADTQRLRMGFKLNMSDALLANIIFDQEAIVGDFAHTADFNAIRNRNQKNLAFLDGDKVYTDTDHLYAKYSLYRAYLKYYHSGFQATLGKQLIDWGRCRFWSSMDLFNPISPLDIEWDERIGVDALNIELPLSSLSSLNIIYAPRRSFEESSAGSRVYYQAGNYDLFFMGGEFKKDEVVGFGFDGYIGDGGVRGEFTQTHADNERDFFRGVIGAEYNFPNKVYILGEYFYNGGAENNNIAEFISSYQLSSRVLTLEKNLLGLWIEYEITPLIKWENYAIYDFDSKGVFLNPELRYNIWKNFDLSLGMQLFWGNRDSEFGSYQNLYYLQTKYFF